MATVSLTYTAQLADLRKQLASIPDITAAESRKAVAELNKVIKQATKGASKANKAVRASSADAADGLKRLGAAAGGTFGEIGNRVEDFSAGLKGLASPIGLATAGAVGLAAGIAAFTAATVKAVLAADELQEELEGLQHLQGFELVDPAQVQAIERVNGAVEALAAISKQVVVVFAAEFAPALERIAVNVVAFGLAALDVARFLGDFPTVLEAVRRGLVEGMLAPIDLVVDRLTMLATVVSGIARAVGADGLAADLQAAVGAWAGFREEVVDTAIAGVDVVDFLGNYTDRAVELIDTLGSLKTSQQELNQELAKTIEFKAGLTAVDEQEIATGQLLEAQQAQNAANELARLAEQTEARQQAAEIWLNSISSASDAMTKVIIDNNEDLTKRQRTALKALIVASKAAAIFDIAIKTQQAIAAALTIPPPAGPILAIANAAAGTAAAIQVAAQPIPEFPIGAASLDHTQMAALQQGESVLNRDATTELGADTIRALNAGRGGGDRAVVAVSMLNSASFDPFVRQELLTGGALSQAVFGRSSGLHRRRGT